MLRNRSQRFWGSSLPTAISRGFCCGKGEYLNLLISSPFLTKYIWVGFGIHLDCFTTSFAAWLLQICVAGRQALRCPPTTPELRRSVTKSPRIEPMGIDFVPSVAHQTATLV